MIQIDVWGGDLHQNFVRRHKTDSWLSATKIIENEVETGFLVNVLHSDFKFPPERQGEVDEALASVVATAKAVMK